MRVKTMPVWLSVQIGLMCFWLVFGIYIYYTKLWKATFPVSRKYFFWFTFVLLVPSLVSLSSIFLGLIYILFTDAGIELSRPIAFLFIIPGAYLTILLLYTLIQCIYSFRLKIKQNQKKQEILDFCNEWIRQFSFIKHEMYHIKVYFLDDKVEGRIKIKGLTSEEMSILKNAGSTLPDSIYLYLVPKRE
jgi:hypothetical protein